MLSELSAEALAHLHVKNRVEYSNLSVHLNRIEKEKQLEIKMHNTAKYKFRAKYRKANMTLIPDQTTEIKMYETHTPGFCFKRNGEQRLPQTPSTRSIDFEHLHLLLFTDGEVDIEKVLCLHLLSAHETRHLTPPKRLNTVATFMKKDSPLEQIIERSKEVDVDSISVSSALPTYVLDVRQQTDHQRMKEDERLTSRLLVNEKLMQLILTVMGALEDTNPEKFSDMMNIAEDPGNLKRIFRKPHIQEFVMTLKDNTLVNSCNSFVLTAPRRESPNHIEIRTPGGALEELVRFIRSNVLQFRGRDTLRSLEVRATGAAAAEAAKPAAAAKLKTALILRDTPPAQRLSPAPEAAAEVNPFRRTSKNFILKNIKAVGTCRRPSEEAEEPPPPPPKRRSVEERRQSEGAASSVSREPRPSRTGRSSETSEELRVHTKQTTCAACMERWRRPLPLPKVSKLVRASDESSQHSLGGGGGSGGGLLARTANVQQRISTLINDEQFKLDSYDRKYSNAAPGVGVFRRRSSTPPTDSVENMDLSVFDLEKVKQEIRVRETRKKLEKFLEE